MSETVTSIYVNESTSAATRDDLLHSLVAATRLVDARGAWFASAVAEAVGLNRTDMECIDILLINGPSTAGTLSSLSGLTTGAITGVIDRLEEAGFVYRERDISDRRKVIVHINQERVDREIMPLYASLTEQLNALHARYTDQEIELIADFASRMADVMYQELVRLRETIANR